MLTVKNDSELSISSDVIQKIISLEKMAREVKAARDELTAQILAEMDARDVIKFESDELILTRVPATERETFDAKAFREDFPELYDDYVKMSPVKSSLRIKVK